MFGRRKKVEEPTSPNGGRTMFMGEAPPIDSKEQRLQKGARALAQEKGSDATPGATPERQYDLDAAYIGGHRLAEIVGDAEKDHGRVAELERRVAALEKAREPMVAAGVREHVAATPGGKVGDAVCCLHKAWPTDVTTCCSEGSCAAVACTSRVIGGLT